jgi:parallel beta-helix repeat protein
LLDGSALASGPSSSGNATHGYGDNSVVDCVASGNDRAGIHIVGGTGVTVRDNRVEDNRMGIVADSAATGVLVQGNAVRRSSRNGISLIDDVRRASVRGNTIRGGEIGVYVRHSDAMVVSNAVGAATNHGIAVIAATESTTVSHNTVAGRGPSAIDTTRAPQAKVTHNDFSAWTRTKPFFVTLRSIFQPLTVMWIVFGIIVVIGALTGAVKKYRGVIRHPYADQAPLTSLTRGVVTPEELGLRGSPQQGSYALAAPEPEGTA